VGGKRTLNDLKRYRKLLKNVKHSWKKGHKTGCGKRSRDGNEQGQKGKKKRSGLHVRTDKGMAMGGSKGQGQQRGTKKKETPKEKKKGWDRAKTRKGR